MRRVWLFPIEPIEMRYSADWLRWVPSELRTLGHSVRVINPPSKSSIAVGQFLDVFGTNAYKARQLAEFADMLAASAVRDSDVVLMLDGWNPCVEHLGYMRDCSGYNFKIAGCLHAGTWDPHDFITPRVSSWARASESAWWRIFDVLFFATEFHRQLFTKTHQSNARLAVTGFPMKLTELKPFASKTPSNVVLFPHRRAPEKRPEVFASLAQMYSEAYPNDGTAFEWTHGRFTSKEDYLRAVGDAKVVFSASLQETWGIAMLEAAAMQRVVFAPNALSYPETLGRGRRSVLYDVDSNGAVPLEFIVHKIHEIMHARWTVGGYDELPPSWYRWESAVTRWSEELCTL